MFENVNLEKALIHMREERRKELQQERVVSKFKEFFEADWEKERRIKALLDVGAEGAELPDAENFPEDRIYSMSDIEALCIKYRLRFLSSKHFKREFPAEAISAVKKIERNSNTEIKAFMVAAPARMFGLQDVNKDPLLFAPLTDGRFYLIHQWGNDLHWSRSILYWPLATLTNLLISIVVLSAMVAAMVPTGMMAPENGAYFNFYRIAFFAWNLIFISGMVSYFWFATSQKFSTQAWRSKYFN